MSLSDSAIQRSQHYEATDPDVRLMLEVQADNAEAFEELTRRYQNRLLKVMEHLVGNSDQAQDLAQEVFLRVFRSRKSYVPGAKFSTWFFTIANNVASNALRYRSRRKEVNLSPTPNEEHGVQRLESMATEASGLMPSRQLDKQELSQVIKQAMDTLNERQRMALLLCKFEHMSYQQIAETMDLSVQAVKSLLSRARNNLKLALAPYLQTGQLAESFRNPSEDDGE